MTANAQANDTKDNKTTAPPQAAEVKPDKPVPAKIDHNHLLSDTGFVTPPKVVLPDTAPARNNNQETGGYPYPSLTVVPEAAKDQVKPGDAPPKPGDAPPKPGDAPPKPGDAPPKTDQPLSAEQKQAVTNFETQMQRFLPYFLPPKADGTPDQAAIAAAKKQLTDDQGQFGQDARVLYGQFVDWMQKQNGPNTLRLLEQKGLPFPPGGPDFSSQSMKSNDQTTPNADTLKQLASAPDLKMDLHLDPTKVPGTADYNNLDGAIRWMSAAQNVMKNQDQQVMDEAMSKDVQSFGSDSFSRAFQPPTDKSDQTKMDQWRANTQTAVDLAHEMRRYSEASLALRDAGYYGKLNIPLPPGVREDPQNPGQLKYDLPTDPHMDSPENQNRLKAFADWKKQYGDGIDTALTRVEMAKLTPDKMLTWGDVELTGMQAVLKDGKFDKLAQKGAYTPQPGEVLQDATLMQNRFDVRTDDKGNIVVSQNVQAQTAWGYQNMFGVTNVGQPYQSYPSGDIGFKPSDFVPISTAQGMKLIQARDLEAFKRTQQFEQYGQKALIATMDGAMIAGAVTGVGAVAEGLGAAALAGGRVALEEGAEITTKELALQGAKAGLKLTVAAAGVFNNADAQSTSWGATINQWRGYYFMADIGLGATKGATLLNPTERAQQFLQQQFSKSAWVSAIDKGTNYAFKATEYGYVPQIAQANYQALDRLFGQHAQDSLPDAYRFLVDKKELGQAGPGDFDVTKADALKGTTDLLTNYETTLGRDNGGKAKSDVTSILDQTKEVLNLEAAGDPKADAAKKALVDQLIAQESLNGDEVKALNAYAQNAADPSRGRDMARPLNGYQLSQLYAGKVPDGMGVDLGEHLQQMAEGMIAARDPDLAAARRISLLYLTRDKDGNLPESLGSATVALPFGSNRATLGDLQYKDQVSIDTSSLVTRLRSELAVPTDANGAVTSNRGLAVGDVLTRIGGITDHQYADVLGSMLESPNVSKADKIQALLGGQGIDYATLVQGVRSEEAAGISSPGASTSQDLEHHLDALPRSSTDDKDVRALAAMLGFGLAPENLRALPAIVSAARSAVNSDGQFTPGVFSNSTTGYLENNILAKPVDTSTTSTELTVRLDAAKALNLLGTDNPDLKKAAALGLASDHPEQQIGAFAELANPSNGQPLLETLREADPNAYQTTLAAYVKATEAATKSATSGDASGLEREKQLLAVIDGYAPLLSTEQRHELSQSLNQCYMSARADTQDNSVAAKTLALNAITSLDPKASIPTLTAAAGLPSDGKSEQSPQIRQLALSKLNQMHYEGMKDLVGKLLNSEQDPAVRKTLSDMAYAYQDAPGPAIDKATDGPKASFDAALQASTGEAHEILQKTKTLLDLDTRGDPNAAQAKAQYLAQLSKQEMFSSDEIKQMNYFLSYSPDSNTNGRPLSAQDVSDLYNGKIPSWATGTQGQELQRMAEGFLAKRDPQLEEARRISMLYLARDSDGQLPTSVATTPVTFPLPSVPNVPFSQDTSYIQGVPINTDGLVRRLRADLSSNAALSQAEKPLLEGLLPASTNSAANGLTPAQIAWMHDKFPLLSGSDYTAAVQQAGNDSMSLLARIFSSNQTIDRTGMNAISQVSSQRQQEWDQLVQYAMNTYGSEAISQEDSANARAVLFSILSHNGQPMGTDGSVIPWRSHQATSTSDPLYNSNSYWQNKAADALAAASQPGVLGRDQTEDYFKKALADGNDLTPEARLALLKAWSQYYSPMNQLNGTRATGASFISVSEYTQTLMAAYEAEADRQRRGLGSAAYMAELQKAIQGLPGDLAMSMFPPLTPATLNG